MTDTITTMQNLRTSPFGAAAMLGNATAPHRERLARLITIMKAKRLPGHYLLPAFFKRLDITHLHGPGDYTFFDKSVLDCRIIALHSAAHSDDPDFAREWEAFGEVLPKVRTDVVGPGYRNLKWCAPTQRPDERIRIRVPAPTR